MINFYIQRLEIVYIAPRTLAITTPLAILTAAGMNSARTRPLADEFLMYGRWAGLTNVTLINLRCASSVAPSFFLSSHPALEVLHMDLNIHGGATGGGGALKLPQGSLPRLKEIHASKDIINAILECLPLEGQKPRPLEVLKGFKLSGNFSISFAPQSIGAASRTVSDSIFLSNLKQFAGGAIKRVEMVGWHDMEDVRKLVSVVPNIHHLDLGRRLGTSNTTVRCPPGGGGNSSSSTTNGPATNMVEWAELLATLPELIIFHGVRFFYEVSSLNIGASTVLPASHSANTNSWSDTTMPGSGTTSNGTPALSTHSSSAMATSSAKNHLSMMERSRMRKNDEIAGVLAWKCRKLRRVDHWEDHGNKVIVLLRDDGKERDSKVRWEVRRVKL